jgi:hypothetical protein
MVPCNLASKYRTRFRNLCLNVLLEFIEMVICRDRGKIFVVLNTRELYAQL